MAYDPRELAVLGYANGFTLWHYRSGDPLAEVPAAGYFAPAGKMLRAGDFLFTNLGAGVHAVLVAAASAGEQSLCVQALGASCPPIRAAPAGDRAAA